ncbi:MULTISPECIES: hypothetical protein [Neisseria]|uniref:hypothetical protein n=1 Tax=Neisseria TaxID=482 RepID=UPI00195A15E0|nr:MULTISPECIES: hypothetical protein [Neisseria]
MSLKQQFKLWLEQEQKNDEMFVFATIPHILRRFDCRFAIIKGHQLEKRYLREWREAFRIDRKLFNWLCFNDVLIFNFRKVAI